jgi:hypothetical protein
MAARRNRPPCSHLIVGYRSRLDSGATGMRQSTFAPFP